jgi:hypothetical protein
VSAAWCVGIHHCLGAALARAEGQEALGRPLRCFAKFALAGGDVERKPTITIGGPARLPIAVGATVTAVARVAEVWRHPVKSMQGERIDSSSVDERGLAFDRAYALMDAVTGKVASAKRPRPWGASLHMHTRVADDEAHRAGLPVVEVSFGGETTVINGADDSAAAREIGLVSLVSWVTD